MFHDRQDQVLVHNEIVVHMDINKNVHYKSTNYLHLEIVSFKTYYKKLEFINDNNMYTCSVIDKIKCLYTMKLLYIWTSTKMYTTSLQTIYILK